jgi:predicted lysophospholipase L1 biosynthesis ABC-type transport system permease subunit
VIRAALLRLRAAPRRAVLAALGVVLAAAMAGAAITVGYALHTGFDRAAREADLPDVIVRFRPERRAAVDAIVRRLPNLAARSYRTQVSRRRIAGGSGASDNGAIELVEGRRGYAIVDGRDVDGRAGEVVVDRGVANEWGIDVGDRITAGFLGRVRVAGIAVAPDNVAFPLSSVPHVYVSNAWIARLARLRADQHFVVNEALIWAHDPAAVDVLLQQARATSTGISNVRFLTRSGVRVLVDSAAGIVIALLVAFSLVALAAAGVMLAAGASADVQRRLQTIGVQRAIGVSRAAVAAEYGLAAAAVGLVAGAIGLAAGALAASGPSTRLLEALNEQPPGAAFLPVLGLALVAIAILVGLAAAWPAWRATGRPTVALLRGAELGGSKPRHLGVAAGGFGMLGARLALARRGRAVATLAVLTVSGAVILLMLGLASLVAALRDDPGSVGKRYQLTARLAAEAVPDVRAIRSRSASRSSCSRSRATTRGSRTRRSRRAAGCAATPRLRSAWAWRRRSGSGAAPRLPCSSRRVARRASASSAPCARSIRTAASPTCAPNACWPPIPACCRRLSSACARAPTGPSSAHA